MEAPEAAKLAIKEQFVRKVEQGEYEGPRYELVIVTEDGELVRRLYREEEE